MAGEVKAFAGNSTPAGWLLCDGSAVSRTTYARLFEVIGTTYGSGDGESTFNLPNLIDRFVEGSATAGTEKSAGLPNITGETTNVFAVGGGNTTSLGALEVLISNVGTFQTGSSGASKGLKFNASKSNSIYGNSNTVQPPALTMRYIIKF